VRPKPQITSSAKQQDVVLAQHLLDEWENNLMAAR